MAYIITTEELQHVIGEGSDPDFPFLVVLSRSEGGGLRLETLGAWLSRHARPKKGAVPPTLSPPSSTGAVSDTG